MIAKFVIYFILKLKYKLIIQILKTFKYVNCDQAVLYWINWGGWYAFTAENLANEPSERLSCGIEPIEVL